MTFECDIDLVLEMERAGIGVEEIVAYATACLSRSDCRAIVARLEVSDRKAAPSLGTEGESSIPHHGIAIHHPREGGFQCWSP